MNETLKVVEEYGWHLKNAAKALGISSGGLSHRLRRLNVPPQKRGRKLGDSKWGSGKIAILLEKHQGNMSAAARSIGVSRQYVHAMFHRHITGRYDSHGKLL